MSVVASLRRAATIGASLIPAMKRISVLLCLLSALSVSAAATRPNIILIFTDDQGYNDLGCFGSKKIRTPNIDRMAKEGLKLTSFYAQPVCGVSRAALMTGSYPIRVAEPGNMKRLHTVPHPKEVTMAETLRGAGYATAIVGKWHLTEKKAGAPGGFDPATMPNAQGFDYFYGTPLFNGFTVYVDDTRFRSPIFRNEKVVVEAVETWDHITRDYTKEALQWIEKNRERPFFLYLAHNLPHIPVGASEDFKGRSAYGPYGDTIEEIDWSCGEIVKKLKELDLDENTLIVFTSDNGPWVETTRGMKPGAGRFIPRDHSGDASPLRGWKMSAWDGGCRVPCVMRWPAGIPAGGESDQLLSAMDLLPTFAKLAGAKPPKAELDGSDAADFLTGKAKESPREDYFYYTGCLLTGVRAGDWKLVLPRRENPAGTGWWGRMIEAVEETQLFDLTKDPGESQNVAVAHPEVVKRLMARIERARAELGDIDKTGSGARFFEDGPRRLQVPVKPRNARAKKPAPVKPEYDGVKPVGNLRFTFESGQLDGWKIVAGMAGKAVSDLSALPQWKHRPYNKEGKFHLSTINTGKGVTDKQTATFVSPQFFIEGDRASFLASGGFQADTLYIALCDAKTGEALLKAGGPRGSQMKRVNWNVKPFKGRIVFLKVVDQYTGGWGHLTFDDFSVQGRLALAKERLSEVERSWNDGLPSSGRPLK